MKKSTGLLVAAAAGAVLGAMAVLRLKGRNKSARDIWKEGTKKFSKEADEILAEARKNFDKLAKEYRDEQMAREKVNGI